MIKISAWLGEKTLMLSDFGSVLEVGVGLFVGLAIIQTISSNNTQNFRLKVETLDNAVKREQKTQFYNEVNKLYNSATELEIKLETLQKPFLFIIALFLVVTISGLSLSAFFSEFEISNIVAISICLLYLGIPILILVVFSIIADLMSTQARTNLKKVRKNFIQASIKTL